MFLNSLIKDLKSKKPLSLILTQRENQNELTIFSKIENEFDFKILKYDSLVEAEFVFEALESRFSINSRVVSDHCVNNKVKRQRRVFIDHFDNLTIYENKNRVQLIADCVLKERRSSYNVFFNTKSKDVMSGYQLDNVAIHRLN
ncbi:hypothetical protein PQE20_17690 [Vibrio harveyi]|uniref:hypothetical protein n=1 Tax=Vibrio harveyi group TaxID=717610 RepID=UPI000BE261DE|nr:MULTISPECIES: hypothetical protein [Vibrio harveyi group]ATI44247.1 hypothetical protein CO725_00915 [Vibrio parahaemolyticus]WCP83251.1 hypothetical protein PQE20_17690 [Vibrio harveyi]